MNGTRGVAYSRVEYSFYTRAREYIGCTNIRGTSRKEEDPHATCTRT